MGKIKVPKHKSPSILKQILSEQKSVSSLESDNHLVISLKHYDSTQLGGFRHFNEIGKLCEVLETLHGYSHDSIEAQTGEKFTIYGDFPQSGKTAYYHPKHVPPDAQWARIHVDGIHCIIGHVVRNRFYLVFLDPEHKFYFSQLKNT